MLKHAAAGLIGLYQTRISPHKGYCCAYRIQTGRHSCSAYAKRLVLKKGILFLSAGLARQLGRCRASYLLLMANAEQSEQEKKKRKQRKAQEHDCDDFYVCDCDDLANCDSCEVGDCGSSD